MHLEKYLVLNKYIVSLFGFKNFSELREELKNTREGFDNDGKSYFVDVLIGLENLKLDINELLRYDAAIKEYAERLSKKRRAPIVLKYFQYLAILFAEIYFDFYFNKKKIFLKELNSFLENYRKSENVEISNFDEKDLKKLAYWMATGSGKTLIMHINYWQFLKYNTEHIDNIILITPNEGLSKQHALELEKSGIQYLLYTENTNNNMLHDKIFIIDIHKLTEVKKGQGVQVDVNSFDGKNLVFIDEGHKGQSTEEQKWKKLREKLGKNGFLFEYSATFGQVINENNTDLLNEYAKAIIFDYSYKYFYTDGYGKDFFVYEVETNQQETMGETILVANLISFYEQMVLYEEYEEKLKPYLIEKPLWAFVGSKVTGAGLDSDVLKVVLFLKKIYEQRDFLKEKIEQILKGKSGLKFNGEDIFKNKFEYFREKKLDVDKLIEKIFNAKIGNFSFYELKKTEGEIGLKIGESDFFGVINIGDVDKFKKLLEEKKIEIKTDNFSDSLFEKINENDSKINILIGSKKFIEGWDSWRVCSMGLINMGSSEGPQIIQLFGRGVRLKGKNFSLKRSSDNFYWLKSLETLNIFGLNAEYINAFLESIRKEEVEFVELEFPITIMEEKRWRNNLITLTPAKNFKFEEQYFFELCYNENVANRVKIDLRPRVRVAHGLNEAEKIDIAEKEFRIKKYANLLDFEDIYIKLLEFKINKNYKNLIIKKETIKELLENNIGTIYVDNPNLVFKKFDDLKNLNEIALMLLKSYIEKYYYTELKKKETENLEKTYLLKEDANLSFNYYKLKIEIPNDEKEKKERMILIKKIKKIIENIDKYFEKDIEEIPALHLDEHIYTPLLVYDENKDFIISEPVKLNEGETKFIKKLRDFMKKNKKLNKEVYLLRNLSKRGINFFHKAGFYPDFMMWVINKENNEQTLVFLDPKGIRNLGSCKDEKVQLHRTIKETEKEINEKNPDSPIKLESFILSVTDYDDIKDVFDDGKKTKAELEKCHILFLNDDDLIEKLFNMIEKNKRNG